MSSHPHVWDGSYEPTQAELEEPVRLEGVHDYNLDEAAARILSYTPPPDATWPDDGQLGGLALSRITPQSLRLLTQAVQVCAR